LEKWPFFLLTAASCAITFLAQRGTAVVSLEMYPVSLRLSNALVSCTNYLLKMVWPADLAILYPLPGHIPAWHTVAAAAMLAAISFLSWRARRQRPWLLAGWLWFLGTLAPVIGLVQVGPQAMADRYTYVPLIGISMLFAWSAGMAQARWRISKTTAGVAAMLVMVACAALTMEQLRYWQNGETLFRHTLAVTTNNANAHLALGEELKKQGRWDEALAEMQTAWQLEDSRFTQTAAYKKESAYIHFLLADNFKQQGRQTNALAEYREALRLDPVNAEAHNDLGNLLDETGESDEALQEYREAVRFKPEAPLAHYNLGTLLVKLGRHDEAMREYAEAARLNPDDSRPHYLMGKACLRRGQSREAIAHFRDALRLNPNDFQTLAFLARVLASDESPRLRNGPEAVTLAEQANALTGGKQPFVLDALAMACAEAGRFNDAQQTVQKAIALAAAAGEKDMAFAMQQRLELYQSGQPCHETFTNAPAQLR
jgi:tetratricopeptide (TPR) repeat protein